MSARFAVRTCSCGRGKAEVLESHGRPLRSVVARRFTRPHVIRLVTYVRVPRGVTKRISRRVLFARDGWKCVYCGSGGNRLDARPRRPPLPRRDVVWENVVDVVRALQPPQGRPPARGDEHEPAHAAATADAGALHPPRGRARAGHVAAVPPGARRLRARPSRPPSELYRAIARSTASCSSGESATDERPRSRSLT